MKLLGNLSAALLVGLLSIGSLGCPKDDPAQEPVIVDFSATPTGITAGESSALNWETRNAVSLALVDGAGNTIDIASAGIATGTVSVTPSDTMEYTLTATGGEATTPVTARLTITVAPADVCGDGSVTGTEACDDSNTADGDYCSADCSTVSGACGDGTTQTNEACDDTNTTDGDYCSADCSAITGTCGDGTTQTNEACDDSNVVDGDYCDADCQTANGACGDGTVETFEACDDSNLVDGDYCAADCMSVTGTCGDSITQTNELCDDGNIVAGDYCDVDCLSITGACGDGTQQTNEVCDDSNIVAGDYCDVDCLTIIGFCGDSTTQTNELCDDGNTTAGDYCDVDCLTVIGSCGDGTQQSNEACEDSNTVDGDGCRADCMGLEVCGDTLTDVGEACDDGNTADGDGCRADCMGLEVCGDTYLDVGEECDDGNTTDGDGCSALCVLEGGSCSLPYDLNVAGDLGDGTFMWSSDTGNFSANFNATCQVSGNNPEAFAAFTAAAAGDYYVLVAGAGWTPVMWIWDAVCDVASTELACEGSSFTDFEDASVTLTAGQTIFIVVDGYGNSTTNEGAFDLLVAPEICGDGLLVNAETCDDGNTTAGDGCDDLCAVEAGYACPTPGSACRAIACGDGFVDGTETCDDSNTTAGDGCDDLCATEAGYACPTAGSACRMISCGDGFADAPEQCDDGGTVTGDGCGATCDWEGASCADPYDLTTLGLQGDGTYLWQNDTSNFTADYAASCATSTGPADGVANFVAPADATYVISMDGGFDKVLWVWDAACDVTPNVLACRDSTVSTPEIAVVDLLSGEEINIVVDGWGSGTSAEGAFTLAVIPIICGDGIFDAGIEECEDSNTATGDGCSDSCEIEAGWDCPSGAACVFVCGNGTVDASETCDDGNATALDGCSDSCLLEAGFTCDTGVSPTTCASWALPATVGDLVITEVMQNPDAVNDGQGEWFEIHNPTATDFQLLGITVADDGTNVNETFTVDLPVGLVAGDYAVFALNGDTAVNGGMFVDYVYPPLPSGISLGNGTDGLIITDSTGVTMIDTVIWDGGTTFPDPTGNTMALMDGMDAATNDVGTNWCNGSMAYGDGDLGSPGVANPVMDCLTVLMAESFDTWPLTGWSIEDGGDSTDTWMECTQSDHTLSNSVGGSYACADSDAAGSGVDMVEGLVTPSFSAVGMTTVSLSFTHYHNQLGGGSAYVELSLDGGTTYVNVATYAGDTTNGAAEVLDISGLAAGQATVQLRFRYEDAGSWAWYWLIDDVYVTGS